MVVYILCAFKISKISRLNNCQLILDLSGCKCKNLNSPTINKLRNYIYTTLLIQKERNEIKLPRIMMFDLGVVSIGLQLNWTNFRLD